MLTTAIFDCFVTDKIATKVPMNNPFTKKPIGLLNKSGIIGLGILAMGGICGFIFNLYDKKHPDNKVGNFFYILMNGPKSIKK